MNGELLTGRYRLVDELGRGGLGSVWRARDELVGREVAVKRLHPEFGADLRLRRRLRREARAVARLDHPHIVRLYDLGEDEAGPFLVMEMARGTGLHRLGPLSPPRIIDVLDQILGALAYAHARGVVHRDLKPDNVAVSQGTDGRDRLKLLDFGFAWVEDDLDEELSLADRDVFGTPQYMAPEQAMREDQVGPSADLYSVGIIGWELCCGAPPFMGPTGASVLLQQVNDPLPAFTPIEGLEVPAGLADWFVRALAKEPAGRFDSAGSMRRALAAIAGAAEITVDALDPLDVLDGSLSGEDLSEDSMSTVTVQGLVPPEDAPIIGRDVLRRWLWSHVVAVCGEAPPARVLMLEGRPGMGRTRLCEWLSRIVAEGGWMTVASGRYQQGVPSGLRAALRRVIGLDRRPPFDREAAAASALEALGATDIEPALLVRCLWPETGPCPTSRTRRIVEQLVRLLAERRPLFLCLDDLHRAWAEDLDLVEHLVVALAARPAPVLLLCTRPDVPMVGQLTAGEARVAAFIKRRQEFIGTRQVGRLTDDDVDALVQQTLLVDPEVSETVSRSARGNPLVALTGLTWLMEQQALGLDDSAGVHRFVGIPPAIPTQPLALVAERLELAFQRRDGAFLRALAEHFALLGDAFAFGLALPLARRLGISDSRLLSGLDTLVRLGILEDREADVFAFRNASAREALLRAANARPDQAAMHAPVAAAKEAWYAARPGLAAAEIARHHLAAEAVEAAVRCQVAAAGYARRALRLKVAMALYAEADRWLSNESGGEEGPRSALWADVLLGLAETVLEQRQAARALSIAERVLAWARRSAAGDHARAAAVIRGEALSGVGRLDDARAVLDGVAGAAAAAGAQAERARALLALGRLALRGGDLLEAAEQLQAAADAAEVAGDRRGEAASRQALGELALRQGDQARAAIALERAAQVARTVEDEPLRGAIHWRLGELERKAGRAAEAMPHFRTAADAFEAAGNTSGLGRCLRGLGDAQWALRQPEAEVSYRLAIETFGALGDDYQLAVCLTQAGRVAMEAGELETAEQDYARAAAHLEPLGDAPRLGMLHAFRARVAHRRGLGAARDLHLDAARRVDEHHPLIFAEWANVLDLLAGAVAEEQPGRARQMWNRSMTIWRALGRVEQALRVERRVADALEG